LTQYKCTGAGCLRGLRVRAGRVLGLPTGGDICVCLADLADSLDLGIRVALGVLEQLYGRSLMHASAERCFAVRVGLNEHQDNLVTDIDGGLNRVGLGINATHHWRRSRDRPSCSWGSPCTPASRSGRWNREAAAGSAGPRCVQSVFRQFSADVRRMLSLEVLTECIGNGIVMGRSRELRPWPGK